MKNSKKGFTLVELIIVVAVIALLAAVLIPTFSSLISKANQAKDEALVSNLNKAIALSTEKYDTVYDVLGAVKENAGFDVAKISASVSEHEILWDSVNYCFVYKTEKGITGIPDTQTNKDVKDYQYWQFLSKEIPAVADQKYSIYWAGADLAEANVAVGFDAGEAQVTTLNYEHNAAAKADGYNTIIRTNGATNINVNAQYDTLAHHGSAGAVKVIKCAMDSYHEVGKVTTLTVENGHVEIAATAKVTALVVEETNKDNVKLSANEGCEIVNAVLPSTIEGRDQVVAKAENIVSATDDTLNVTTVDALNKVLAVNSGYVYVRLGADIDAKDTSILIAPNGGNANITIDGNGKKITSVNSRLIQTCKNNNNSFTGHLNISNLCLISNCEKPTGGTPNIRVLSLWKYSGTLNMVGCKITMKEGYDSYGVNIAGASDGVFNFNNTEITAYQCLNIYGKNRVVNVDNCTLNAVNTHNDSYTGAGITIFEDSSAAEVNVANSSFITRSAVGKAPEYGIAFGSALGKSIYANVNVSNSTINGAKFDEKATNSIGYWKDNLTNGMLKIDGKVVLSK